MFFYVVLTLIDYYSVISFRYTSRSAVPAKPLTPILDDNYSSFKESVPKKRSPKKPQRRAEIDKLLQANKLFRYVYFHKMHYIFLIC